MQPSIRPILPVQADVVALSAFDFGCILDKAEAEREAGRGALTELLGLSGAELGALRDAWAPRRPLDDLHLRRCIPVVRVEHLAACIGDLGDAVGFHRLAAIGENRIDGGMLQR